MKTFLRYAGALAAVAVLAGLPWMVDSYVISLASDVLVLGLLAMSINFLTGVTGLPTLGQAAYFGAGMCRTTVTPRAPISMTQAEPFGVFRRPTSSWHTSPCVHRTVPAPVVARNGMTSARAAPSASAWISSTSTPSAAPSGSTV